MVRKVGLPQEVRTGLRAGIWRQHDVALADLLDQRRPVAAIK